jgi:hypothetical protein
MNLKARIGRLRKATGAGCADCREDDKPVVSWIEPGDSPPPAPPTRTCARCGRIVARQHLVVSWQG